MTATITGTLLLPSGDPDRGAVSFAVYDPAIIEEVPGGTGEHVVTAAPVVASLDGTGSFTVVLTMSENPRWRLDEDTMAAGGMPYVIIINTQGLRGTYTAYLPEGASRLEDLINLDAPPGVVTVPVEGDPGYSPVVTVESTTTGAPGTDAAVVDTDPGPDVALAFTIPQGDKGDPGDGGDPSTYLRITRPNVDDIHVEQYDATLGEWVTVRYDSGWRALDLINGWEGTFYIRRTHTRLYFQASQLLAENATSDTFMNLPTGNEWRLISNSAYGVAFNATDSTLATMKVSSTYSLRIIGGDGTSNEYRLLAELDPLSVAIPTSLPGTLVSPAPN